MAPEERTALEAELNTGIEALIGRARGGDQAALGTLREMVESAPDAFNAAANLAREVEHSWVAVVASGNPLVAIVTEYGVERMRRDLAGPDATPLEALLVDRIVATWLEVQVAAQQVPSKLRQGGVDRALLDHLQNWTDRAQKRHLAAIKALAQVRRLQVPVLIGQLNVAQQQVNQVNAA